MRFANHDLRTWTRMIFLSMCYFAISEAAPWQASAQTLNTPTNEITFTNSGGRSATAPVVISQILVEGKQTPFDAPVSVQRHWLHTLVVVVQNVSTKIIVFGGVGVIFPESGLGTHESPRVGDQMYLGKYPDAALYRKDGTKAASPESFRLNEAISIQPGQTMRFLFDINADAVQDSAAQHTGNIRVVDVELTTFYFQDGMKWAAGSFLAPGITPGTWKAISPEEFHLSQQSETK